MEHWIQTLVTHAVPVIFAITLHEAAHGYVAKYFGDPTAWNLGRVSANPLRHIDPIGTILVPGLFLLFASGTGLMFGWAKPVPVEYERLRNPRRDMVWVAAAGPAANLAMLCVWALLWKFGLTHAGSSYAGVAIAMGQAGVAINAVLMVLNLLPFPPLDGGRILVSLLPRAWESYFEQIEPAVVIILLILMAAHTLDAILLPLLKALLKLVYLVFNL